jgi:hypothetical protein
LESNRSIKTLGGKLTSQEVVTMQDVRLPDFDINRRIDQHKCLVHDNDDCKYNIILGSKFLSKTGIKLNYANETMDWFDTILPLRPTGVGLKAEDLDVMVDAFHSQVENELGEDWLENFATAMLDAKYEFIDIRQVIDQQSHLNMHGKADLLEVLAKKHQKMFHGTLGVYPHKKVFTLT